MANENKIYKTKQKQEILEYFKKLPNFHLTAHQIYEHLKEIGTPVGITTIYRHLEKFVAQGIIKKYVLDGKNCAYFEYIDKDLKDNFHFHFKCNKCGELFHFKCEELKNMHLHFLEKHNMTIDLSKTIYYGICDKCN